MRLTTLVLHPGNTCQRSILQIGHNSSYLPRENNERTPTFGQHQFLASVHQSICQSGDLSILIVVGCFKVARAHFWVSCSCRAIVPQWYMRLCLDSRRWLEWGKTAWMYALNQGSCKRECKSAVEFLDNHTNAYIPVLDVSARKAFILESAATLVGSLSGRTRVDLERSIEPLSQRSNVITQLSLTYNTQCSSRILR